MEYLYEINRKDLSEKKLSKLIKWLEKNKISYVKLEDKILIKHEDFYFLYKFDKFIEALKIGFPFKEAQKIIIDNWELLKIDVKKASEKKINHFIRISSRIIGEKGKFLRKVEEVTKAKIIFKDKTLYILGDSVSVQAAYESFKRLIKGSSHSKVLEFAVKYKKHLKNKEKEVDFYRKFF